LVQFQKICKELNYTFQKEGIDLVLGSQYAEIPEHPALMNFSRYRMLREHYTLQYNNYLTSTHKLNELADLLQSEQLKLTELLESEEKHLPEYQKAIIISEKDLQDKKLRAESKTNPKILQASKTPKIYVDPIYEPIAPLPQKNSTISESLALERLNNRLKLNKSLQEKRHVLVIPPKKPPVEPKPLIVPQEPISLEFIKDQKSLAPYPIIKAIPHNDLKEKKNSLFRFSPETIRFHDAVPGKIYKRIVKIRNIGVTLDNLHATKLDIEIENMINIKMDSKKLVIGGHTFLEIEFAPNIDFVNDGIYQLKFKSYFNAIQSITLELKIPKCCPFLSGAGGLNVDQVSFLSKDHKRTGANLIAQSESAKLIENVCYLDFGACLYGNVKKLWLDFGNDGLVGTEMSVTAINSNGEALFNAGEFSFHCLDNFLGGYSSKRVHFEFAPSQSTDNHGEKSVVKYQVSFAGVDSVYIIECFGKPLDLPISLEKSILDFNYCFTRTDYRDFLVVKNENPIGLRVWLDFSPLKIQDEERGFKIDVPSVGELHLSSSFGFVQQNQNYSFCFGLKVSEDALKISAGEFEIPFKVKYTEPTQKQRKSIQAKIIGRKTSNKVLVTAQSTTFEPASVFEMAAKELFIENLSDIPQLAKISTGSPEFVLVGSSPKNELFVSLDPRQSVTRIVEFRPTEQKAYNANISCLSSNGGYSNLNLQGIGISPPLYFSKQVIEFEKTAHGSMRSQMIQIKISPNQKNVPNMVWEFEFGKPFLLSQTSNETDEDISSYAIELPKDGSLISTIPERGIIDSEGCKICIQVSINVPKSSNNGAILAALKAKKIEEDLVKSKELAKKDPKSKKPKNEPAPVVEVAAEAAVSTEIEKLKINNFTVSYMIPCLITSRCVEGFTLDETVEDVDASSPQIHTIYLKVTAPIFKPCIELEDPEDAKIEFDDLSVGGLKTRFFHIINRTQETVTLKCDGVNPEAPFYLAKAIRPILPGEKLKILVGFNPKSAGSYFSCWVLSSLNTTISIKIIGRSILPTIDIDGIEDFYNFGNICIGDQPTKTFKVTNKSLLPIDILANFYDTELIGTKNFSKDNAFSVSPSRIKILAKQSVEFVLKFSPDRASNLYRQYLKVSIIGLEYNKSFLVSGSAWGYTCGLIGQDEHPSSYEPFNTSTSPVESLEKAVMLKYRSPLSELKLSDDELNNCYLSTISSGINFETITLDWIEKHVAGDTQDFKVWQINPKSLVLTNLKPMGKIEAKKQIPCEFKVEESSETFVYDAVLNDYVVVPRAPQDSKLKFVLDITEGSIELGSSKTIQIHAENALKDIYERVSNIWMPYKGQNQIENSKESAKLVEPEYKYRMIPNNVADKYKQKMEDLECRQPQMIENVFKISMTNGYRLIEPKGFSAEPAVYFVKIRARFPQ
jgi:hypothetical protein